MGKFTWCPRTEQNPWGVYISKEKEPDNSDTNYIPDYTIPNTYDEKAINILQKNGILGFITPNKFYKTKYGKELRQYLIKYKIIELVDFFELKVFEDASTDSQILILDVFG